ncbi:cytochrome P450 3A9-like isoform X2 [Pieris rapae]|nr:cytochrome P450 3A9-like isoform X2 [Pieris rapae]
MQPLIDTKTSELVKRIQSTEDKTKISLRYLFTDFTTDIFATAAFGIKTNATLTGKDPMRTITAAFMKFDLYRGLNWISIFFFPKLVDIFRFSLFPKSATDHFRRVFNIVSQQRLSKRNSESKDFLDVLLKMKEEGANAEAISDDIIIAQAAIFLFGGFETSGSILSFATYELAFHQDVQEKLYNELKEVQMQSKDGRLDITKLAELPYINAVAKETLRKYVPMGWLDRVAAMDYKVDDNLTIPAGTPIYVNAIGMQHDSNIYPDPETFNPDRFLPENAKNIQPYTYLPFGDGPRHCIGKRFAQISVRHGIANLILNYQIVPVPGAPKPNEVEFEKQGLFLVPGQHLYVNFVSRNQD